jgi:PAS domain S-box-containing protein
MFRFSFSSLRSRLIVLILLAILPALGLTLYTGLEERQIQSIQAKENALRLTRLAAGDLVQVTEGARQLLIGLAQLTEVRQTNTMVCGNLFANLLRQYPYYVNLGVIGSDGNILCSAIPLQSPVDLSDRGYFQRAFNKRGFAVSGYQVDRATGKPTMNFALPVLDDAGVVLAVVFAALDLAWFNQIVVEAQLPAQAALLVVDHKSMILAHYPDSEKWVGQHIPEVPLVRAVMLQEDESIVETSGLDNITRLHGVTIIRADPNARLFVSIGLSKEAALDSANRVFVRNLVALGLVGALGLLAAWFGGDIFILRRINRLVAATRQLAEGDLSVRIGPWYGDDELKVLAGSFDEMATSLEQRTLQLYEAETKYRTLVEQIPMVTYVTHLDRKGETLYISPQIESVLGFSPDEWVVDSGLWLSRIHSDDLESVLAAFSFKPPNPARTKFHSEYRLLSKSGDVLWFLDEAVVMQGSSGEPRFLHGILVDITEQKNTEKELKSSRQQLRDLAAHLETVREEERTWIAREIHDELGQSLTGLKMELSWLDKKISDPSYPASTRFLAEKIDSMKTIVDMTILSVRSIATQLRPGILDNLGLIAAIEWQVFDFQSRTGIECEFLSLPVDTSLDEKFSSAIFRIFQEILTNVTRHAKATSVSTSMREEAGTLILEVRDNGRGITEEETYNAKSLGLLGMRERVDLLGGQFSIMGVCGEGTIVTVRVPIADGLRH